MKAMQSGGDPETIVEKIGWKQVIDTGAIEALCAQAIADNPEPRDGWNRSCFALWSRIGLAGE